MCCCRCSSQGTLVNFTAHLHSGSRWSIDIPCRLREALSGETSPLCVHGQARFLMAIAWQSTNHPMRPAHLSVEAGAVVSDASGQMPSDTVGQSPARHRPRHFFESYFPAGVQGRFCGNCLHIGTRRHTLSDPTSLTGLVSWTQTIPVFFSFFYNGFTTVCNIPPPLR